MSGEREVRGLLIRHLGPHTRTRCSSSKTDDSNREGVWYADGCVCVSLVQQEGEGKPEGWN